MDGTNTPAPVVFDVGAADFKARVIEASRHAPVVVDFWAGWCAPCRMLGPVLEREVGALGGRVSLAKLDVDANRELAAAFEIQGIPAVKAFVDGKVVDAFEGARDARFVRGFLERLSPSDAKKKLAQASTMSELRALLGDPEVGPLALVQLAPKLIADAHAGEALELLEKTRFAPELAEKAELLKQRARFAAEAFAGGGEGQARTALEKNPEDLEARWRLAGALAAREAYEEALAELLELVKTNRKFKDDGARKMMLMIFEELGHGHELTRDFRRKLLVVL